MQTVRCWVHIIEVRELPGKDSAGLCDPFVRVTVGNEKKQTAIRYHQTSTVFNEDFYFSDLTLTPEEYEKAKIRVEVFDARVFFSNELIGHTIFSIPQIRNKRTHELYQKWVELEHPSGGGQGFVRLSLSVLGAMDAPTGHSQIATSRTKTEIFRDPRAPPNEVGLVIQAPNLGKRRGYNFQIKCFRAEDLVAEGNNFLAVHFNGVLQSTPVKPRSKNPDWNYQINMAVFTPRYADIVEVSLWSNSAVSSTLIGSVIVKFSDVISRIYPPTWFNLYGFPADETGVSAWWNEMMTKKKIEPTAYIGRLLLSFAASLEDNPVHEEKLTEPVAGPETETYSIWIDVLKGYDLHKSIPFNGDVRVEFDFGPAENNRCTNWCNVVYEDSMEIPTSNSGEPKKSDIKVVNFNCIPSKGDAWIDEDGNPLKFAQFKEIEVVLPKVDPKDGPRKTDQLWNMFFSVSIRDTFNRRTRIGYVKIRPSDVWGFDNDPEWFPIRGTVDKETGVSISPGHLLLCVRFGPRHLRDKYLSTKKRPNFGQMITRKEKYEIRAYVYQAKDLPSSNASTGLLSSFVQLKMGDVEATRKYTIWHRKFKTCRNCKKSQQLGLIVCTTCYPRCRNPQCNKPSHSGVDRCTCGTPYLHLLANGEPEAERHLNRTTVAKDTLNPIWCDTLILKCELTEYDATQIKNKTKKSRPLPPLNSNSVGNTAVLAGGSGVDSNTPKKLYASVALNPDIELILKSEDSKDPTDFIGKIRFPTELATRKFWPKRARPRWLRLIKNDATLVRLDVNDKQPPRVNFDAGELLVKIEVLPEGKSLRQPWYTRHRWPMMNRSVVVLGTLGLRSLIPHSVSVLDDDSNVEADAVENLTRLEIRVPLFPDLRSKFKQALKNVDEKKSKQHGSDSILDLRRVKIGEDGGDDDLDSIESLDSDEEAEQREFELGEEGATISTPLPTSVEEIHSLPIEQQTVEEEIVQLIENETSTDNAKGLRDFALYDLSLIGNYDDIDSGGNTSAGTTTENVNGTANRSSRPLAKLYQNHPAERSFSFYKVVRLYVNYPTDSFFAPVMTIRLMAKSTGYFATAIEQVFGSAVVPLRNYSGEGEKLAEFPFQFPRVALSRTGKDQFEAIARRDSEYTNSTNTTRQQDLGSAASEMTIHSLYLREVSKATLEEEDDEDKGAGGGGGGGNDELEAPIKVACSDLRRSVVLDSDKLNTDFQIELNPSYSEENLEDFDLLNVSTVPTEGGEEVNGDDEEEEDQEEEVEKKAKEQQQALTENAVQRSLNEFTGVFWPIGVSKKQLIVDTVEANLEDDPWTIQPLPFQRLLLKNGAVVENNEKTVGVFKAVIQVDQDLTGEQDGNSNSTSSRGYTDVYVKDAAEVTGDREFVDNDESPMFTYLTGGYSLFEDLDEVKDLIPPHKLVTEGVLDVKVRVYIVQAKGLWSRYPEKAAPYLKVKMKVPKRSLGVDGKVVYIDDHFNKKTGTSPFFGTMYELDARFPDITQLEIYAYDSATLIGGPDFIGSTKIDLEDRWFNPKWQVMKAKKKIFREFRSLSIPTSTITRGTLEMWVEIYKPFEAMNVKKVDIRKPKTESWEMRLVVWETHNVPPPDGQTYLSHYVTTEFSYHETDVNGKTNFREEYQSTDTHYWCGTGVGSFNWRNKFTFDIPCRFPRLTFKVWQTDLITLTPDLVVGTATVDIDFLIAVAEVWEGDEPYERPKMVIKLTQDRGTANRGELHIQIHLLKKKVADSDPVGFGRDPPNKDPYLPEPKRESFWSFLSGGSGWCFKIFCCLLILGIIGGIIAVIVVFAPK